MKDFNKRIMSLLLSGALVSSVGTMKASAVNNNYLSSNTYIEDTLLEENNMNGIYRVMVYGKPVYVYLNNSYQNKYLNKNDALFVGELNYETVYVYEKTIDNPKFINGVSPLREKTITIYALSGERYVSGWNRIEKSDILISEKIATTIELGEFLLKQPDLTSYLYSMVGFANIDLNSDGKYDEIIYLGNNKLNNVMSKTDAIKWAVNIYDDYYFFKKTIYNVDNKKTKMTFYAIGEENIQNGWSRISKSDVPDDALVATNVDLYNALINIAYNNNISIKTINTLLQKSVLDNEINKSYNFKGMYKVFVDEQLIYAYLNNSLYNEYLNKNDALFIGELNYENVYIYEKTIDNPNYINGVSPLNEKTITIYALSGENYVSGWKRVNKENISLNDKVATTIELGEFLLKQSDLKTYLYSMVGFANIDLNNDGKCDELVYLGNNKINRILTKNDAIKWAMSVYDYYYLFMKTIDDPNNSKNKINIYAISDRSYVSEWNRVYKKDIPEDAFIATNTEFYEALLNINKIMKLNLEYSESYDKKPEDKHENSLDNITYAYAEKNIALNYGYRYYKDFCILSKIIKNETIYTLSTEIIISRDGWNIVGNNDIPENANVFLSMQDALNYEYLINNNYIKSLKRN